MKILFQTTGNDATGSHRILYPIQALKENIANMEVQVLNETQLDDQLKWADIVVMQCLIGSQQFSLIERIKSDGKALVIDYDDNFSVLPVNILKKVNLTSEEAANNWQVYLKMADLITTTTPKLAEIINQKRDGLPKAVLLPNYIRLQDYGNSISYTPWLPEEEIRILYSCSDSHQKDIEYLAPILDLLASVYKNIKIISQGNIDFTFLRPNFKGKVYHTGAVPYSNYLGALKKLKPHIFVAPLQDSEHNRCRSDLKFLQSAILKCAFICNDLDPYSDIKDGITGLKVTNRLGWAWYLRKLVRDRSLAINLGLNSYQDASKMILENHINRWRDAYLTAMEIASAGKN